MKKQWRVIYKDGSRSQLVTKSDALVAMEIDDGVESISKMYGRFRRLIKRNDIHVIEFFVSW
ncbi:MAG: hypothetical protein GF411_14355 [Candidatus Lokiarchaeota archaeon]|nr:hypothetical protein [Candidatus Lokiarchaeota archaeon]